MRLSGKYINLRSGCRMSPRTTDQDQSYDEVRIPGEVHMGRIEVEKLGAYRWLFSVISTYRTLHYLDLSAL